MKFSTTSASLLSIAFLQQASANVQKRQYDTAAPWLEVASYSSIDPSVSAAYDVTASGGSPTVIYPTTAASVAAESLASSSTMVYPTSTSPATDTAMPSASMSADTSSSVMSSSSSMMSDSSTAAVWSSSMTDSAMPSLPTYAAVNSGGAPAYAPVNSGGNVAAPAPPAYAPVNSGGGGEMGMAKHHHNKGYGSGSHGKKNKGYQMCVQTCKVAFGQGSASSSSPSSSDGSSTVDGKLIAGPGEIVVAPKLGDLRMVPFAMTAAAGTNVTFVWGAGPHTVTQSTLGAICNKSTEAGAFASGPQNATFKYPVQITQDSSPTFYFCGVKKHCEMGMFGIINPQSTKDVESSFGNWMDNYAKKDAEFKKMKMEAESDCAGNEEAMNWGKMYDIAQVPKWSLPYAAESIMATRSYFARNARLQVVDVSNVTTSTTEAVAVPTLAASLPSAIAASDVTSPSPVAAAAKSSGVSNGLSSGSIKAVAASSISAMVVAAGLAALMM